MPWGAPHMRRLDDGRFGDDPPYLALKRAQTGGVDGGLAKTEQRNLAHRLDCRKDPQLRKAANAQSPVRGQDEVEREKEDVHAPLAPYTSRVTLCTPGAASARVTRARCRPV